MQFLQDLKVQLENKIAATEESKKSECTKKHPANCDICKTRGIVGIRYKCIICDDFDVCESCEGKGFH